MLSSARVSDVNFDASKSSVPSSTIPFDVATKASPMPVYACRPLSAGGAAPDAPAAEPSRFTTPPRFMYIDASRSLGSCDCTVAYAFTDVRLARFPWAVSMTSSTTVLLLPITAVWLITENTTSLPPPVPDVTATPSNAVVDHVVRAPTGPVLYLSSAACALASSLLAISTATGGDADPEPVDRIDEKADSRTTTETLDPSQGRTSSWLSPLPESVESSQWLTVASRDAPLSPGNRSRSPATASFCPAEGSSSKFT